MSTSRRIAGSSCKVAIVVLVLGLVFTCALVTSSWGAFFDLPAIGCRADGTGGAMVALADDSLSAVYYNPGALPDVKGDDFVLGSFFIFFPSKYKSQTGYSEKNEKKSFAPSFGLSTDRFKPFYFGIAMYGSTGMGFTFKEDPPHGIHARFDSEMGNMFLSPTVSYKISEKLGIGAGLNITYGKMKTHMPIPTGEVLCLDVDGMSYGMNIGILYRPIKSVGLGLRWRSPQKAVLKGDADFSGIKDHVRVTQYWPHLLSAGFSYRPTENLVLLFDFEWINYSRFGSKSHYSYKKLTFLNGPYIDDIKDAKRIHVGLEYDANEMFIWRLGYLYNPRCIAEHHVSPLMAANTYQTIHIGSGIRLTRKLQLDLAANYSFSPTQRISYTDSGYPGTYKQEKCYGLDVAIRYRF